jgi:hypothetical protein
LTVDAFGALYPKAANGLTEEFILNAIFDGIVGGYFLPEAASRQPG